MEIKLAFEAQIGHEINKSTIYRLLDRQGWQQLGAQAGPAQANAGKLTRSDTVPARERREPSAKANRELSAQRYPSDLRDQEWAILEPLIPPAKPGGRPRTVNMREVINAILYVDRTGCQWRALPHDFPPWSTV